MPLFTYLTVFATFARNSLVRDMTFRVNFLVEFVSSTTWVLMYLGFYLLVFQYTSSIGAGTGWGKYEFFVFLATTMVVNSLVQAFFMENCDEISELIRTGGLDFALLKPIDTQFLVSLRRVSWSSLGNLFVGLGLLIYSCWQLASRDGRPHELSQLVRLSFGLPVPEIEPIAIGPVTVLLYIFYCLCGVAFMYSLMISLSATSIWLGRNTSLYDFWFYITNFARYPMEIYDGAWGRPLRFAFSYILPVLLVVYVPARLMALPLAPHESPGTLAFLALFTILATIGSLFASRAVFQFALASYRSASS